MSVILDPVEYSKYNISGSDDDSDPSALGKDEFLELLLVQIANQDPLNPMDDTEFISQMAEFSSLEQLNNISDGIGDINSTLERQDLMNAVSFIGQEVMAEGYSLSKNDDSVSTVYYSFDESVQDVYVNIYDSDNNIVNTVDLGAMSAGSYQYVWDGLDYDGVEADNGVYQIYIAAVTADGSTALVTSAVSGEVSGVITNDGDNYLVLEDGRSIDFLDVYQIVAPASTSDNNSSDESDDTSSNDSSDDGSDDGSGDE
ncbi:MAG: flagellar basal-body rod modification protein FlgD [Desulfovibrionales bacterium]|jgi:flagellar basal-body rod modification protein FlgD|nr:flagellar basal-body rod modification protein FlgD [Desulfovibrionales bacterium]